MPGGNDPPKLPETGWRGREGGLPHLLSQELENPLVKRLEGMAPGLLAPGLLVMLTSFSTWSLVSIPLREKNQSNRKKETKKNYNNHKLSRGNN